MDGTYSLIRKVDGMRRLQIIEAMNFAEKKGFVYVIEYWPSAQYKMHFARPEWSVRVLKHLKKLDMPVEDGTLV